MTFFRYVRDHNNHPVACIASDGTNYGVSICNPIDRFNKSIGRKKAEGRMLSKMWRNVTPYLNRRLITVNGQMGLATFELSLYVDTKANGFVIETRRHINGLAVKD